MHTFQLSPESGHELAGNAGEVPSPALLVYPDRIVENVKRMIEMSGGNTGRLRPHVKTNKMAEVVRIMQSAGIGKFKCATIAEAEMLGDCRAEDVLLAMQAVGPNIPRLIGLIEKFRNLTDEGGEKLSGSRFSALVDSEAAVFQLGQAAERAGVSLPVYVDIDCGMHRSGVPASAAGEVIDAILGIPGVELGGLHVYDGHIHEADPAERAERCQKDWEDVEELRRRLRQDPRLSPKKVPVIAGGTPTFPIHVKREQDIDECSPGTVILWDAGYASQYADLPFLHAALVLTRVISKPGKNRLCLDLGHKAIASENPLERRVRLAGPLHDAVPVSHSEEHLVIETPHAGEFELGSPVYGVPWHICPTVALYDEAVAVTGQRAADRWKIVARSRKISI